MTSTKSHYKSAFGSVFLLTLKQRLANIISILVAAVLIPILFSAYELINFVNYESTYSDKTYTVIGLLAAVVVVCGFFSLSIAPKMFKDIYKKQSCDTFFALPIKRHEYFLAKYCVGALTNIVAYIISGVLFTVSLSSIYAGTKTRIVFDYGTLTSIGISMLLALLSIYTAFVLCAVTAGKRIHYIFFAIICLFFSSNATVGATSALNSIWGYYTNASIFNAINPAKNVITAVNTEKNILAISIISIIEIVGMLALGVIAFNKRKAESAEGAPSGKVVPYIFLAVLTSAVFMSYSATGVLIVAVVIGAILSAIFGMIFTALFYKQAFTKQTGITVIATCLACTMFLSAIYIPSHSKFINKIPEADQIESIEFYEVSANNFDVGMLGLVESSINGYEEYSGFTVTSEEGIEKMLALHEKLIDQDTIDKVKAANLFSLVQLMGQGLFYEGEYIETYSCQLKYTLTNGRTLNRTYTVASSSVLDEMVDLFKTEEVLDQLTPFNIKDEDLLFATFEPYNAYDDGYESDSLLDSFTSNYYYDYVTVDPRLALDTYKHDLMTTNNKYSLFENVVSDYCYYDGYYGNEYAYINVYYVDENARESIKNELKSMSLAEIIRLCDGYYFDDPHEEELYEAVLQTWVTVYEENEGTVDLIDKTITMYSSQFDAQEQ